MRNTLFSELAAFGSVKTVEFKTAPFGLDLNCDTLSCPLEATGRPAMGTFFT